MARNQIPLDEELSHVSILTGRPLDMRIVPADDAGDEKTVSAIHAMNLLNIAERTMPESGDVYATPTGISQVEYDFLVGLFNKFGGLSKDWFDGRLQAYSLLKNPKIRKESQGMQKLYAGFRDFFGDLTLPTKLVILNSWGQSEACKAIEEKIKDEKALEKIYNHMTENRDQDWSVLKTVDDCWYILFKEQYEEMNGVKSQVYLPKIKKTESAVKLVKGMVHQVLKDGRIDDIEKEIVKNILLKRFEGFDTVDQHCIDKMSDDISVKDILFNLALTGRLDGVNVPKMGGELEGEIYKIPAKVERVKALLGQLGSEKVDNERLHLMVYALQNMIGIRGLSNCGLILSDYGVESQQLQDLGLHDMPAVRQLSEDMDYLRKCEYPEIRALVQANPGRF